MILLRGKRLRNLAQLFFTIFSLQCWIVLSNAAQDIDVPEPKISFSLSTVTALEEPFIYAESGVYRGFNIDVLTAIKSILESKTHSKITYTVRQPHDGQIGSIDKVDGVFEELLRGQSDIALSPISRNWFQNPQKALDLGLNFTAPIMVSKLSSLVSRRSQEILLSDRFKQCQASMIRLYGNGVPETYKLKPAELCRNNEPLTLEELFQNKEIIKLVLENSAVHKFLQQHDWDIKDQLHLIQRSDLYPAIDKVREDFYALIHESMFTHYQADKDCNLVTIDQTPIVYYNELKNVILDQETFTPTALAYSSGRDGENPGKKLELKLFENEQSFVINRKVERKYELEFNRSLIRDFNLAINQLRQSGELERLKRKHWAQFCRKNFFNSSPRIQNILSVVSSILISVSLAFLL